MSKRRGSRMAETGIAERLDRRPTCGTPPAHHRRRPGAPWSWKRGTSAHTDQGTWLPKKRTSLSGPCTTTSRQKSISSLRCSIKWAATLKASPCFVIPHRVGRQQEKLHRRASPFRPGLPAPAPIGPAHRVLELSSDPFATEILERLDQTTTGVYMELLEDLEPGRARTIVRTMDAVLDSQLRAWSAGRLPITGVYDYLSESIDLIFGDGPEVPADEVRGRREPTKVREVR